MIDNIKEVADKYRQYPTAAYALIFETLEWLRPVTSGINHHLPGDILARAVYEYCVQRYGLLANMILDELNIHRSEDLGVIVYHLVHEGLITKDPTDEQSHFDSIFTTEDERVKVRIEYGEEGEGRYHRWVPIVFYDMVPWEDK